MRKGQCPGCAAGIRVLVNSYDNFFQRKAQSLGAAFNKMKLIDDETEKIRLCDIVIDAFLKTPQRTRYHFFQKAAEEKAKLIDEPSLPLVLWDQVIQNNVTEEAVVQARIERLPLLPNDRERLAACDELIAAHQASMSDYAQLMVARAMIQKARFIPDTEEKAALLRATFEKCASIMDSRARVVASDALALLATLDRDVAAVIHYYDELSAMSEEQRDMLRALEKNTGLLAGPMEKILAYDEVIESSANADSRESREIAAMAMLEKAELTDDLDEKIKLYDAMLFEMGDIRGRYFFSHIFRDRIDMTADVDEQWGVLDYYDDVHGNYLDPDTLMLRDLDSVVVMLNNGHPYGALHLCGIVIDSCEKYLNSEESAYGVSLGKDFERTSIMDTLGKAILFKANSITSVDEKIELYDKYLSFPQPELPHFMNALAGKIRAKNAELITGTNPFLFI